MTCKGIELEQRLFAQDCADNCRYQLHKYWVIKHQVNNCCICN